MKRVISVLVLAFTLLATLVPAASADEWCELDPLVRVITPAGSRQYVHITFSAPSRDYLLEMQQATLSWTAVPTADGQGTLVTVTSTVPLGRHPVAFPTRATISTLPNSGGTVYSSTEGTAGIIMTNTYQLNIP